MVVTVIERKFHHQAQQWKKSDKDKGISTIEPAIDELQQLSLTPSPPLVCKTQLSCHRGKAV